MDVQQSLDPWTPTFVAERQAEDPDLGQVQDWLRTQSVPEWDDLRGQSPSLKAYYKQLDSLYLKNDVIYRRLEPTVNQVGPDQLLLPRTLRSEFLSLVHGGVAGHLGMYKTHMHVRRRAYWFRWREETDIFL